MDKCFMPAEDDEVEKLLESPSFRPKVGGRGMKRLMPSTPVGYSSFAKDQGVSLTYRILKKKW